MRKHERNFCLATIGQLRILCTISEEHKKAWLDGNPSPIELVNPHIYLEMPGRTAGEIQTGILPMQHMATAKSVWATPNIIELFEHENKYFKQYEDAINRWAAHCSGILAPTQQDVLRVQGGSGGKTQP